MASALAPAGDRSGAATLAVGTQAGTSVLALAGSLDAAGVAPLWHQVLAAAKDAAGTDLAADLSAVTHCDTAGVALLLRAEAVHGGRLELRGATPAVAKLFDRLRDLPAPTPPVAPVPASLRAVLHDGMAAALAGFVFLGEVTLAFLHLPRRRRQLRWGEFLRAADSSGVRAVPLVLLMGFLMGLILAFQSAIPLRRFGADLYVADLVAVSLLRELGPLLAAVILSGRTGSAIAAELGTMKVNEEIAALTTMGLDPMILLVLPRLLAAMLVMPAMALLLDIAGLGGMTVVMQALGYPPAAVAAEVVQATTTGDLAGGLFKAVVFGVVIAAIGCRAGLAAGTGPRAVGESATRAVVGGIVATIALDGVFAVLFYVLGL